jgi:hypothetical protein
MGKITVTAKTPIESLEATITIDEEATVKELTQEVAPKFGFNPEDAVIMFRGIELQLDQTLKEADIQDGFAVLVSPQAIPKLITVHVRNALGDKRISMRVEPDATLREVLEKAVPQLELDISQVSPMHKGVRLSLGDTIVNTGIEDDSTVVLTPRMDEPTEPPPQVVQPSAPPPRVQTGTSTITPADEKLLREMLGMYKMKSDSLEQKTKNSFLVPKKAVYVFIVIVIILAVLVVLWPYLTTS